MKNKNLIKLYKKILKFIGAETFQYLFTIAVMLLVYGKLTIGKLNIENIIDLSLIMSLFITFMATKISFQLSIFIKNKLEDHEKLNTNYDAIVAKYPRCKNIISYVNKAEANYKLGRKFTSSKRKNTRGIEDEYIFPVVIEAKTKGREIIINDKDSFYSPPAEIEKNKDKIMAAHKFSTVYNQINVRLDNILATNHSISLETSRTTYFHSLITNRAMDYKWCDITNREYYSPGPFFESLKESKLSNHLGLLLSTRMCTTLLIKMCTTCL